MWGTSFTDFRVSRKESISSSEERKNDIFIQSKKLSFIIVNKDRSQILNSSLLIYYSLNLISSFTSTADILFIMHSIPEAKSSSTKPSVMMLDNSNVLLIKINK